MNIVICDIDGTIADLSHRLHFIQTHPKDWDKFHSGCGSDQPISPICKILDAFESVGASFIYVTGRPERNRTDTLKWLDAMSLPKPYALHMRKEGDYRNDDILKKEIYEEHLAPYRDKILFVLEDRSRVVKMWRGLGLTCLQVADGDY